MNNELKIFENAEFGSIRTVEMNGTPYFVGKDVAEVLGYSNPQKAIRDHVDDEDRGVNEMDTPGGKQNIAVINESGLYSLILSSKLPKAKEFKRWVTSEVLPAIRKYKVYALEELMNDPDFVIRAFTALKEEKEKNRSLETAVKVQRQQIAELKPKADYMDTILKNKSLMTITQIAKDYGMSGKKMNKLLHELDIQYKQSGQWFMYANYQNRGWTHSELIEINRSDGRTDFKFETKWTQKGRLELYQFLKKKGILPLIECNEAP